MTQTEFWIDQGGTFTDCILSQEGRVVGVVKVPTSDDAPLRGMRALLDLPSTAPLPPCTLRLGTTKTTNALLERKGVATALVITRGFADLTRIGTQARPDIFELEVARVEPLFDRVLEVDARSDADGAVLAMPDPTEIRKALAELKAAGIRSLAIACVFAFKNPAPELAIREAALDVGFEYISLSHEVSGELGFLKRADTTLLDANLTPLLRSHFAHLEAQLGPGNLRIMQSSGELTTAGQLRGHQSILSGPAGGVVALSHVRELAGAAAVIGFDMGGTSTDVSRFAGELPLNYASTVNGTRIAAPSLDIHTVAAGGGSLCRYDGSRMTVGPESAGSSPGPLCYGHPQATELTITDVNLALGRLQADRFPLPLHSKPVRDALDNLRKRLEQKGTKLSVEQIADGFLRIASANMAQAVKRISVDRGFDVRSDTLVVYGGAGGQHAGAVARELGITHVVFHPLAGVLSAWGVGLAEEGHRESLDLGEQSLTAEALAALEPQVERARSRLVSLLEDASTQPRHEFRLALSYPGTDSMLVLAWTAGRDCAQEAVRLEREFHALHTERFGYARPNEPVLLRTLHSSLQIRRLEPPYVAPQSAPEQPPPSPLRRESIWFDDRFEHTPVFSREQLVAGVVVTGPAYVIEDTGAIVVERHCSLRAEAGGLLRMTVTPPSEMRERTAESESFDNDSVDPVLLELVGNAFGHVAGEMGSVLAATAVSTNIRERLDFSCAVFTRDAQLLANAPHIPVHLGAMSETVAHIAQRFSPPEPGDAYVTNDPTAGGSHLPDVTVVSPVFSASGEHLFYVASRGHHADIGGTTPGSMPATSTKLCEEGVLIRARRLVSKGEMDRQGLLDVLRSGPYPARTPEQNLADLEAQLAANRHGERSLLALLVRFGRSPLLRYAQLLMSEASAQVGKLLAALPAGRREFRDSLDDGTPIAVHLERRGGRLRVAFDATPEHPGNSNAPLAVVRAALIYTLRCLIGSRLPMNSGVLDRIDLEVPERTLLSPGPDCAVVSGNVETSQRIVDVLLAALGAAAASQGTMNNITFGDERRAYYETLGGGMGATEAADGASAIQCHMTNTRITDVEVVESRYPVRVLRFAIRGGSGGAGARHGGHGLIREIEFLAPMTVTLLTERRRLAPFGLAGGSPGAAGRNTLNGRDLPGRIQFEAKVGDVLTIATPGGGGYGTALP